jgi:GntR family transcriptional regulator, transcriptional repressor for pyruvate dehydrogenase complex
MSDIMKFDPITSRRSFDDIAENIRRIIVSGSSVPGDRLPSEKELASQFQVGRQAVREGLRILESAGLIRVRKGSTGGIFVSELTTENVTTSISNIIKLRNVSLKNLTEVRIELEKIILVYAIDRMTEETLNALEDAILRAENRLAQGERSTNENVEFHLILSRATQNEMFHILMESVMKMVSEFLEKLKPTRAQSQRVLEDHRTLLKLIRKRDRRRCVERMEKHLQDIENRLTPRAVKSKIK